MTTIRELLVETWVEYGLSTLIIALRLFTRAKMVGRRLQADDYMMVVAWVLSPPALRALSADMCRCSTRP